MAFIRHHPYVFGNWYFCIMVMSLKVLSLFSGIGAFEKALERLNIDFELVNYCEIDKYASKAYSLIHNCSESLNLGDITKVDIDELAKKRN